MKRTILALAVGLLTLSAGGPRQPAGEHFSFVTIAEAAATSSKLGDLTPFRSIVDRASGGPDGADLVLA